MFRYIALAWNEQSEAQVLAASHLGRRVLACRGWGSALRMPGLQVFTVGSRPNVNEVYDLPGQRAAVIGRIFRRSEPPLDPAPSPRITPEEARRIAHTQGWALTREWWGRYVALLPAPAGGLAVMRDPTGSLPCFRTFHLDVAIAFAWLEDLTVAWPELPVPEVDWTNLGAHLLLGRLAGQGTALQTVHQVPAGVLLPLTDRDRPVALSWNPVDFASEVLDLEPLEAAQRLRFTVRACARSWAACYEGILLRLSGGVDSAILLSCLDSMTPARGITCLNYHAPGADGDERDYARLAAERARRPLIERECDPGFALEAVLSVALTPTPESYMGRLSMAQMDAEIARERGAEALFTGGGGDQLFFELRCTWPASDYLRTRGLDAGFLRAVADAARLGRVSVWHAAWRALVDGLARAALPNAPGQHLRLVSDGLRAAIGDPGDHAHPALQRPCPLPVGKLQQAVELMAPAAYHDPYLREAAPEIVNPLMSQPVMELCLALPTYLLTHGGRGRALARQAFRQDIPTQIADRRSKGGLEEHLAEVLQRNLAFARGLLIEGELVRRGLLDRRRVEAALAGQPGIHDAHVGEIHNCIAIEAWLQRHASLARPTAP